MEYFHLWQVMKDLGRPLGSSEEEMSGRFYSAVSLWMMDLKIYKHAEKEGYFVEFYDVLEALVKKTIYQPQTLDKIYNNINKETLLEGLEELMGQKSSLLIESQEFLKNVEEIRYYYGLKSKKRNYLYELTKAEMPVLVWVILSITRSLRRAVKARKRMVKENEEMKQMLPEIKEETPLLQSNEIVLESGQNKTITEEDMEESFALSENYLDKQVNSDSCETIKDDNIFIIQNDVVSGKLYKFQRAMTDY